MAHMKNSTILSLLFPLVFLFTLFSQPQGQVSSHLAAPAPQTGTLTVDEVLWWLPPDTETLQVAQGPFQLISLSRPQSNERLLEKSLQFSLLGNLTVPERGDAHGFPRPLSGARVQFALQGSRNFRAPRSLGGMLFEGCSIVVFAEDFGKRGDQFLKYLDEQVHPTKRQVAGFPIVIWEEKLEEDQWEFFLARPRPNVLLVATQEAYLREVLERMKSRDSVRAFPEPLPEWKFIDRQARFWTIRHFLRGNEKTDPSSPFGGKKAANEPDENAVGVAFSYGASSGKLAAVFYLSDNPKAVEIARNMWTHPEEGLKATVLAVAPGVVEVQVPMPNEQAAQMFLFVWLAVVGQGIYL